jgi:NAD(P)-dependent dehydrogenase (short-subunit alcohol dehydrogenase family)
VDAGQRLRATLDFLLYDWLGVDRLSERARYAEHSRETFDAVLLTCERIARERYEPYNRLVDTEEPRFDGERVVLPQAAQDALTAGRGSVVLFSSIAARAGFTNHAAIAAAKGAVEGLTVALAAELAPAIRINCIAPSLTRSNMAAPLLANAQMADAIAKQHPIPRLGEGDDAAALADFLLSDQAGWITGQIMAVDGGRSTLRSRG